MRKFFRTMPMVALAVGLLTLIEGPRAATAQATGTLEVTVKHKHR